jgi:hypothetical protein
MAQGRIVAVGLLTQHDVDVLGASFHRLWPVDETPCFSQLLQAIDEADRDLWRARDADDDPKVPSPNMPDARNRT